MKKTSKFILTLSILFSSHLAIAEDYTLGNSNPFSVYHYNNNEENNEITYFSPKIINPMTYIKSSKNDYKNLFNNSSQIQGCWDNAGKTYGVDPWLLMAVAKVESSFNSRAINKNSNKSYDLGIMQINSSWLPVLNKNGITTRDLFNPCTNIFVGSWIMAQNIKHFGFNQDGIGAYNSPGNITIRRNYAKKVYQAYNQLINDFKKNK